MILTPSLSFSVVLEILAKQRNKSRKRNNSYKDWQESRKTGYTTNSQIISLCMYRNPKDSTEKWLELMCELAIQLGSKPNILK